MENNKNTNRNGADTGRYAGATPGQEFRQSTPTPGSANRESFSRDESAERSFRRLNRADSSSNSWERDRDPANRDTLRGFAPRGSSPESFRESRRDYFDEQRMDDEGGAQGYGRDDFGDAQSRTDRYRSFDRSFDRGGERSPSRSDAYQQNDRTQSNRQQNDRYVYAERQERENRYDRANPDRSSDSRRRWWQSEAPSVADVMTKDVKIVGPDATLREIAEIMRKEDVGVVPVVREDGRLHGLVTDRDIVVRGISGSKGIDELRAKDVATTDIEVASSHDQLSDIIELMGRQQIRRVPVVDDKDQLVGIISLADIANRADEDDELQKAFEKISGRRSFWSRIWR